MLTATHTHSAPGGFLQYATFSVFQGFAEDSVAAQVKGIVRSIRVAHNKIQPARIYFSEERGDIQYILHMVKLISNP